MRPSLTHLPGVSSVQMLYKLKTKLFGGCLKSRSVKIPRLSAVEFARYTKETSMIELVVAQLKCFIDFSELILLYFLVLADDYQKI